jgi:ABC-type ATPase with predicted acetyltransferase domain
MGTYVVEKSFSSETKLSPNVLEVAGMFGLGTDKERTIRVIERQEISIEPGQVVYITGASGAGKSLLLRQLKEKMVGAIDLAEQALPSDMPLVDCFEAQLDEALNWLAAAGLSDAFAILRKPEELSDGQKYRFRLALALAQKPGVICIDEFCAALDRISASVVAHNIRRFADRTGTTFIIATSHDDLLEDLEPDVVIIKHLGSQCDVLYPPRMRS